MSIPNLFIRCTHTGVFPGGRANTASVYIPDLDTGKEFQLRKVPVYVPRGGSIDIPASSHSLLSFNNGVIKKFVTAGILQASLFLQPEIYSNGTRPLATAYPAGVSIWNTSDNAPNWSDGAGNWRDGAGVIT